MQPYEEETLVKPWINKVWATYVEAKRDLDQDFGVWVSRTQRRYDEGMSWRLSEYQSMVELRAALGLSPMPPLPGPGKLIVESKRIRNSTSFCGWHGLSEFSAIHLCRTGNEFEVIRRFDRASESGRNGVRVLGMKANLKTGPPAWDAFVLHPWQPGYWAAASRVAYLAAERGMWVEYCLFADTQVVMPNEIDQETYVLDWRDWAAQYPHVFPQGANEPRKNGWTSATDEELLELCAQLPAPMSIGDPADDADVNQAFDTLSQRSQILVLHPSRESSSQWARWVDHLKGLSETPDSTVRECARIHDEPMGAASVFEAGRRDNRPLAHLAASLVCAVMGIGFTYHYISEQDDATPGLDLCNVARMVPQSPDFIFKNAGTDGACVVKFDTYDKVRTCDNGNEAWAVGYGRAAGALEWAAGWTPQMVGDWAQMVDGQPGRVTFWVATR